MYCRLNDDYALRAWRFVNHGVYCRYAADPLRVDADTFDLLLKCDGEHDLPDSEDLRQLIIHGIVTPCERGERPGEWSQYRRYEHRFVPSMNLMLTGKCNYNCRHCFNAADNADCMSEWSWDDLMDLFDQAADCGFHSFSFTGGEPMVYPRFLDAVREIYKRGMVLEKLTTNGSMLTQEVLDEFKRLNCFPQIKISFDGVGCHDWMRQHKGAEERTLDAFRLCAENGFRTMAQVQVYRGNLDALPATLEILEKIGVDSARLIRTTPVERWNKNVPDGSITIPEYFGLMLDLADRYMHGEHTMDLLIWLYLVLHPARKQYHIIPVKDNNGVYHPTHPVCKGNRIKMAVTCDGEIIHCLQMSGTLKEFGYRAESLKERRLKDILSEGKWVSEVCMNHLMLRKQNRECDECPWFGYCGGGCRALAVLDSCMRDGKIDYTACDPMACLFFKGGWYDRIRQRLQDFALR